MVKGALYSKSTGDEGGSRKGIASGTIKDVCEFMKQQTRGRASAVDRCGAVFFDRYCLVLVGHRVQVDRRRADVRVTRGVTDLGERPTTGKSV